MFKVFFSGFVGEATQVVRNWKKCRKNVFVILGVKILQYLSGNPYINTYDTAAAAHTAHNER